MNEMIKGWLLELFDKEIKEVQGANENEQVWLDGSPDSEARTCHKINIEVNKEYIEVLKQLKEKTEREEII